MVAIQEPNYQNGSNALLSKRQELMLLKYTQLKLQRNLEQNKRLKEELSRERVYSSSRCLNIIEFTQKTADYLVPSIWGEPPTELNPYKKYQLDKNKFSHRMVKDAGCCTIM